jgi:iron complex outermembrane receptor protein
VYRRHLACLFPLLIAASTPAAAQTSTEELKLMSLEQLTRVEVTTVSRMPEPAAGVPAALFVITQDDIRRSGATSIAEALRLAPGVQISQINGGTWAIGVRGFADRLARSMLVMIDGRPVYSPLFAGTYWETQDTLLSDIDRIEVIRGPGGTLWGANAVNGIVNIITKPAEQTQGLSLIASAGTQDRAVVGARYGGTRGNASFRGYARFVDRTSEFHPDGNGFDGWRSGQAGFRSDWKLAGDRIATVQGDVYDARLGERPTVALYTAPYARTSNMKAPLSGGNLLARLGGPARGGEYQVQVYYDRTNRHEIPVGEQRDTFDVDFQQSHRLFERNRLNWGLDYRVTSGRIMAVTPTFFTPNTRTDSLVGAFLQDEFSLVPDRGQITVGSKIEHNGYTGAEVQPTARLRWTPSDRQTVWSAVTRAVRTPSRVETDYSTTSFIDLSGTPPTVPTFVRLQPDPGFVSEKLTSYELGYRGRPMTSMSITASAFRNHYDDLLSTDLLPQFSEADRLIIPVTFGNGVHGWSRGVELTADVRARSWWRITANYSYLTVDAAKDPDGSDVSQVATYEGTVAHHQFQLASSLDLRGGWSLDGAVRRISRLASGAIPAYATANVRVARQLGSGLEVWFAGQDLLQRRHVEWPSAGGTVAIERSVSLGLAWRR